MSRAAPPETPADAPEEDSGERYMPPIAHLEELRFRLFISAVFVVVGLGVSVFFGQDLIAFLKEPAEKKNPDFNLQFIEPFELFVTYFRVSLLGGLILGMPMIVYQGLRFVAPGLTPGERRWLYGTTAGAFALFLSGVAFAYYVALPPALDLLLDFGGGDLAEPNIRVGNKAELILRIVS